MVEHGGRNEPSASPTPPGEAVAASDLAKIRELELTGLKRELELHMAYTDHLTRLLDDRVGEITWLHERVERYQAHVDDLIRQIDTERARATEADQALAAERARVSNRVIRVALSAIPYRRRQRRA